ncbi:hypothetical protein GGS21DRAFT_508659 [Xylaria nigripes]|nr:hypothetical protein GGS21DRAFT_508659 [Xylaria nigripes]
MAAITVGLSDDWQQVDDSDTFSIISLSISDDDLLNSSQARQSKSSYDLVHSSNQSEGPTPVDIHLHDSEGGCDKNQLDEICDVEMTDVGSPNNTRTLPSDIVNSGIELEALCERTRPVIRVLSSIVTLISRGQYHPPADEVKAKCEALRSRLVCLQDMLCVCAKHRDGGNRPAGFRVDPGLSEWLENLKSQLLGIRDGLREPGNQNLGMMACMSQTQNPNVQLEDFSSQMDGLMAVVRSDCEEFSLPQMPALSASERALYKYHNESRRSFNSAFPLGNHSFHISRTLYALREQILISLDEIDSCEHQGIINISDQRTQMRSLTLGYRKIKELLDLVPSDHALYSLKYSPAGSLTYPELFRLNPDTIRSLTFQLKEVTDDLLLERCRVQSLRYGNDPDGVLDGEELIIKQSSMDMLCNIEELLARMFHIRDES